MEAKTCPKCGKEHFNKGVFCSRACANSRVQTPEQNKRRSEKLSGIVRGPMKKSTKDKISLGVTKVEPVEFFEERTCRVCGKKYSKQWRKTKRYLIPDTCSLSCARTLASINSNKNAPQKLFLDKCFEDWKKGEDVSSEVSCFSSTIRGEMKITFKARVKSFLDEEQNHKCSICGTNIVEWGGKPITPILDHIDGNPTNHAKSNLRLVCPNCDSQLETHGGKNRGKGRFSERLRYRRQKEALNK